MDPEVSIVIAFHNEKDSLEELISGILTAMCPPCPAYEVILIDDFSSDGGSAIVAEFQSRFPQIKLIRMPERSGQTGCYRKAFQCAGGRYIIRMDADLQDDPDDLPKFLEEIARGSDVITGLRENRQHAMVLRLATSLYDMLIRVLFPSALRTYSASFVCFRADLVRDIPFRVNDHRYLPVIAIRRGAGNVVSVPVNHRRRQYGRSKYKPLQKVLFGIPEVLSFLYRCRRGVYDHGDSSIPERESGFEGR